MKKYDSDKESIFSGSDLHDLWEDITSGAGYMNPDVLATTKTDHLNDSGERRQISEDEIKHMKKVHQVKQLQKQLAEVENMLKDEKQRSVLLEDKIQNMKNNQSRDRNTIKNKLREEIHAEFIEKIEYIEKLYK